VLRERDDDDVRASGVRFGIRIGFHDTREPDAIAGEFPASVRDTAWAP
jgi:hypothetical protein